MTKLLTPFDLASYSPLVNVAGTSPTTTDLRGTSVQGAQREWGALEYDSTLVIVSTTKLITPFDLASYSPLVNVAGTSPTTTDLRGTSVIGAQREWGALEYDSALSIVPAVSGATYTETGADVSPHVANGADVAQRVDTGAVVAPHVASGADVYRHLYIETGAGAQARQASGADVKRNVDTGVAAQSKQISGADIYTPRGAFTDAGAGVVTHVASGADVLRHLYNESGSSASSHEANGADVGRLVDTGAAVSTRAGSAADQLFSRIVYVETGAAVSSHAVSGEDAFIKFYAPGTGTGGGGRVVYRASDEFNASEDDEVMILAALLL